MGSLDLPTPMGSARNQHAFIGSLAVLTLAVLVTIPRASRAAPLFTPPFLSFDAGPEPTSVAIGDLDGDGKPDLAVTNHSLPGVNFPGNTVSVFLGNGDGTFRVGTGFGTGTGSASVAIGDLNADGKPDLAVACLEGNLVSVLLGRGDGTFRAKADYATGASPYSVAIGDLNGDGRPDLIVPNLYSHTVSVMLGTGLGAFSAQSTCATGLNPFSVAIGDLNRDGRPDLAVASGVGVSVLYGNGSGFFSAHTDYVTGNTPHAVAIADLDGDGNPDLVVANRGSNTITMLLGDGNGAFGPKSDYAAGGFPWSMALGDLNGDGRPDLAVTNLDSNTISVLLGNGDGTFATKIDFGTLDRPYSVAVADLNNDRKPDLALASGGGNVQLLLNTSGNVPTPTMLSLVDANADPHHVELSWYGASQAGASATVYRQAEETAWTEVASIAADGTGRFRFEDLNVRPGARYGYRLGVRAGGSEQFYGETSITVPSEWLLALALLAPHPAADRLAIAITLASAAPARLEVVDVAGRIVGRRDVGSLWAGQHVVTFTEAAQWRPGIYLLRLTQGPRSLTARACIVH